MNSVQGLQSFVALEEPLRTSWFCMGLEQEGSVSSGSMDIPAVAFSAPWFLPLLFTEHSQPLLLGWLMKMPLFFHALLLQHCSPQWEGPVLAFQSSSSLMEMP